MYKMTEWHFQWWLRFFSLKFTNISNYENMTWECNQLIIKPFYVLSKLEGFQVQFCDVIFNILPQIDIRKWVTNWYCDLKPSLHSGIGLFRVGSIQFNGRSNQFKVSDKEVQGQKQTWKGNLLLFACLKLLVWSRYLAVFIQMCYSVRLNI